MEQIISGLLTQLERGHISRRTFVQSVAAGVAATSGPAQAASGSPFKAIAVNHISYRVPNYARTRDFYAELFGMRVSQDNGRECCLTFGDTFLIPRNAREPNQKPVVDHIAYTIETWDKNAVEAELKRRGHQPRPDTEDSFHIKDPDGFDVQISGKHMTADS